MRRPQSHPNEVFVCEGEGAGQLNALRSEGFDWVSYAGPDLIDAVSPYLVILHVADLQKESRVNPTGAGLKVLIRGYPNLEREVETLVNHSGGHSARW